jgi:transposase
MEDECHLCWGDVCGQVWSKRNEVVTVEMTNARERQTYYGAINFYTKQFHLQPFPAGNGTSTVAYVKWLQSLYPQARLLLLWDGASYHRYAQMQDFLGELNAGLSPEAWPVTCLLFAPNAPEQNPVEDIWLKGKNWLRKQFAQNKTFAQVKRCFVDFLNHLSFDSCKFHWYHPCP